MFGTRALAPVLGFLLGAWTSTIYVDLTDPQIEQKDPRWVGAWWLGYLICGIFTLIWSVPLLCFPAQLQPNRPICGPARGNKDENKNFKAETADTHSPLIELKLNPRHADSEKQIAVRNSAYAKGIAQQTDISMNADDICGGDRVPNGNGSLLDEEDPDEDPTAAAFAAQTSDFVSDLKDMPVALGRLMRNPIFVFSVLGACCNISLIGYITFLPKYLETHFNQTPSTANIYTGCISAFTWAIGPIIIGRIQSRYKFKVKQALCVIVLIQLVAVLGFTSMMFLPCPAVEWAGHSASVNSTALSNTSSCSAACSCSDSMFLPLCGEDGRDYYSPCMAGCTDILNGTREVFTGCQCVGGHNGTAKVGRCDTNCLTLIPYLVLLGVTSLITSMFPVPLMTVVLRAVEEKDKALSLALSTGVVNLAAFPAPIIYGLVVDSTCLVYQSACADSKGACLWYQTTEMRWRVHALAAGIKFVALLLFLVAVFFSRKRTFPQETKRGIYSADRAEKT